MLNNPFSKIYEEIQDAKTKIDIAIEKTREGRGAALKNNDLHMTKIFKEIEFILKKVLEG